MAYNNKIVLYDCVVSDDETVERELTYRIRKSREKRRRQTNGNRICSRSAV